MLIATGATDDTGGRVLDALKFFATHKYMLFPAYQPQKHSSFSSSLGLTTFPFLRALGMIRSNLTPAPYLLRS